MIYDVNRSVHLWLHSLSRIAPITVVAIGLAVMTGWIADITVLKRILPSLVQMNPVSALLFIVVGACLLYMQMRPGKNLLPMLGALLVTVTALLKLELFVTGWDSGVDTFLFHGALQGNVMAPNTAFNFLLMGLSLFFISRHMERSDAIAQIFTLLSFLISLLALTGYVYNIRSLYVVQTFFPMALHTAGTFIILCAGIFACTGKSGLMRTITANRLGGKLMRRLLPVVILLPLILGWIRFEAQRAGIIANLEFGISLISICTILAFSIIIWFYARSLNQIDEQRRRAERSMLQAKIQAEDARRAQEQFLANMSHEIRTPMNGVIGMTSLLQNTTLTEEQKSFVETIRISGDILLTLINDILDFSKIEAGKLELEEASFSISSVIEETLDLLGPAANKKNLELLYMISPAVPAGAIGDITRLRQVLVNLVSNAIKFTEKGEVLVMADARDRQDGLWELSFSVKDTGIGIPKDKLDALFKAFSQADVSTTRKYGGTGLGLVICSRLVSMMQGRVWVESEPGIGSTFHFSVALPASKEVPDRLKLTENYLIGRSALLVDDNETNLLILSRHCETWGLRVKAVSTAKGALEAARQEKYDLIVSDMMMPETDGIALARQMQAEGLNRDTPRLLLSSLNIAEKTLIGRGSLFEASIIKPVRMIQLYNLLNSILSPEWKAVSKPAPTAVPEDFALTAVEVPLRILVAEDNNINQKLALKVLERLGYQADVAGNGLEAVEAFDRQYYDLVLMDMQMPEMDGLEATREIRKQVKGRGRRPVIIALTANAMSGEREQCLQSGMDDYLSKPFQLKDMRSMIIKWRNDFSRR